MKASDVWIVIPSYNEEVYISKVLQKVCTFSKNIIVVDDGSSDSTKQKATTHDVVVLSHEVNLGKGAALTTGCEYAFSIKNAKAVVVMDSDDQHDPTELPLFIEALCAESLVLGVRSLSDMPRIRALFNSFLSHLVALLFGKYVPDILSGYKGFTKQAYQQIKWGSSSYAVELEMTIHALKKNVSFATIPIKTIYHDMNRGMTFLDSLSIITQIISGRLSR